MKTTDPNAGSAAVAKERLLEILPIDRRATRTPVFIGVDFGADDETVMYWWRP